MSSTRYLICRYHEIILKGKNRRYFEIRLRDNVQRALAGLPQTRLFRLSGRLMVAVPADAPFEEYRDRISRVFGIASYSFAWPVSSDLEVLKGHLWELVRGRSFDTFKIAARRTPHACPIPSPEINRILGAHIQQMSGKGVRLEDPDLTCHVEFVSPDLTFAHFEKIPGAGGLPAGTSGKVAVLLSGGIDSPVAAFKMMRRGCRAVFVHFHGYPHTTLDAQEKVRRLVRLLTRYQGGSVLYMVPFAECQRRIVAGSPPELRVILYRRMMVRIAERISRKQRTRALVTGDAVGQVASQTLPNLDVVSRAARGLVLRPLIGEDKEDIIAQARRIGTYETSIEPEEDCCTLFVPKHPETNARLGRVEEVEAGLDVVGMTEEAFRQAEVEKIAADPPRPQSSGPNPKANGKHQAAKFKA